MLSCVPDLEQDLFNDSISNVPTDLTMVTGWVLPSKRRHTVIQHIIVRDGTSVSWFKFSFFNFECCSLKTK